MTAWHGIELILLGAAIFVLGLAGLALVNVRVAACSAAACVVAAVWFLPLLELTTS